MRNGKFGSRTSNGNPKIIIIKLIIINNRVDISFSFVLIGIGPEVNS